MWRRTSVMALFHWAEPILGFDPGNLLKLIQYALSWMAYFIFISLMITSNITLCFIHTSHTILYYYMKTSTAIPHIKDQGEYYFQLEKGFVKKCTIKHSFDVIRHSGLYRLIYQQIYVKAGKAWVWLITLACSIWLSQFQSFLLDMSDHWRGLLEQQMEPSQCF